MGGRGGYGGVSRNIFCLRRPLHRHAAASNGGLSGGQVPVLAMAWPWFVELRKLKCHFCLSSLGKSTSLRYRAPLPLSVSMIPHCLYPVNIRQVLFLAAGYACSNRIPNRLVAFAVALNLSLVTFIVGASLAFLLARSVLPPSCTRKFFRHFAILDGERQPRFGCVRVFVCLIFSLCICQFVLVACASRMSQARRAQDRP